MHGMKLQLYFTAKKKDFNENFNLSKRFLIRGFVSATRFTNRYNTIQVIRESIKECLVVLFWRKEALQSMP